MYATPEIGAKFIECKLAIEKDGGSKERILNGYENFLYIIRGQVEVIISGKTYSMEKEGYFWLPPMVDFEIKNKKEETAEILWVRKSIRKRNFSLCRTRLFPAYWISRRFTVRRKKNSSVFLLRKTEVLIWL